MAGRKRTYHQAQRYCSATCRKLASKAASSVTSKEAENAPGYYPLIKRHLRVYQSNDFNRLHGAKIESSNAPNGVWQVHRRARPDWSKMYRLMRPDSSLTDMVNLTRARDAAHLLFQENQ
jgi:hypothetical protein